MSALHGEGRPVTRHLRLTAPYAILAVVLANGLSAALRGTQTGVAYNVIFAVAEVIGFVYCIRTTVDRSLDRATRLPWRLLAVFFLLQIVFGVFYGVVLQRPQVPASVLAWAQFGNRICTLPLLLWALLSFAREPMGRAERFRLAYDGVVVAGGGFMVIWYAYAGSRLILTALVQPLLDLVLILGVCTILVRGVHAAGRRPLGLLLGGTLLFLAQDLFVIYHTAHDPGWRPGGLAMVVAGSAFAAMALSAVERTRPGPGRPAGVRLPPSGHIRWLPHLALAVGFSLLLYAATGARPATMVGLVCGAVAMVGGVMARQLAALRQNEFLLTRDSLTGLPNRVELARALGTACEQSARAGLRVGVLLIDLNGFKQINDTYGHAAGDRLLVTFGEVLRRSVRASDTPARLGGDEFAVVIGRLDDRREAVATAERILAAAAAERPLDGLETGIRASIGISLSDPAAPSAPEAPWGSEIPVGSEMPAGSEMPEGSENPSGSENTVAEALLRLADAAMYRAKRAGTDGWALATGAEQPVTARA